MKIKPNMIFAQNFKAVREELELHPSQVGYLLGVSAQQINKYEKGTTRIPMNHIHHLCKEFGLEYDLFFEGFLPSPSAESVAEKIISIPGYTGKKRILNALNALAD